MNVTTETTYKSRSQMQLIILRFKKHKLANISLYVLGIFLLLSLFAEFFVPNDPLGSFTRMNHIPPRRIRFIDAEGKFHLRPFIYGYSQEFNPETWERDWLEDTSTKYPIYFFAKGFEYKLLGLIPTSVHLFNTAEDAQPLLLFGTDRNGRDLFSRTIYATRTSLSMAVLGVVISIVLGIVLGGIAGYYGGVFDEFIQRTSELLLAIPKLPLWMGLAAAVPSTWPITKVYIAIVIISSMTSWPWLARGIRSKLIALRKEDFVMAAQSYGSSNMRIIFRYLIPNFISFIIVNLTLAIPGMILMETSLSFLGLGLRSPAVSWGVLLEQAQNFQTVILYPWLLIPSLFVIVAILSLNFVGDGLRDAADPYEKG